MYKCNFFYCENTEDRQTFPHILSVWQVCTDKHYKYENTSADINPYPEDTSVLLHVLSGKGKINTRRGTYILNAGEYVILQRQDILSYNSESNLWEYLWVDYTGYDCHPNYTVSKYNIGKYESYMIAELLNAGKHQPDNTSYIDGIFTHYLERIHAETFLDSQERHKHINAEEICSYIDQKFMQNQSVADIAKFFNVTPRRLNQILRKSMNTSTKEYIINVKIDKAKQLLTNTSANISEISEMLSFNNPFHFSKVFKQVTGVSPTVYRDKLGKGCNN